MKKGDHVRVVVDHQHHGLTVQLNLKGLEGEIFAIYDSYCRVIFFNHTQSDWFNMSELEQIKD